MLGCLRVGFLLSALGSAVIVPSAHQAAGRQERASRSTRSTEKVRERLRARPAEERERLERHLDELEQLSPEARAKLLERARRLRERERSVDEAVPRELRRRLAGLDSERARVVWGSHLRERFREHGRELRERLPESLRKRLERLSPESRRRFLERLFQQREPASRKALARMHERFGLPGGEIQRLERLPLVERLHAMLEMQRQAAPGAEREGG